MNTPTPKPRRRRTRGLTLIELMIGLGIAAVLMSLAVPSFATYLQRARLKTAAQSLEVDLREARFEAARRGAPLYLAFQGGADWCYAVATTPGCDCHQASSCRLKAQRGSDLRGVQLIESHTMRFDPASGNPEKPGVAAQWGTSGGDRVQVSVNAMGRTHVCALEGTLPPLPGC